MTYGEHPSSTAAAAEDKLWNSDYLKVMCSNFLLFFAFYLIAPLLPLYLNDRFMADKDTIGIVLSGYVVATLMIRPFSGFMVDSFNRKKVLMLCFFVFFICFAGYIGAGTLLMFAIVRTMHGIPFGAATVANSTVAIDVLPSSRRNEGIVSGHIHIFGYRRLPYALLDIAHSGPCRLHMHLARQNTDKRTDKKQTQDEP